MTKIKKFNLVEIIIAMGIIIVSLTTVLGLFASGIKISEEATLRTYSSLIVEQIGGLVETYPKVKSEIPTVITSTSSVDQLEYPTTNNTEIYKQSYSALSNADTNNWTSGLGIRAAENACTTAIDSQDLFFKNGWRKKK